EVVLACAGNDPTLEPQASAGLLRQHLPELAVRVINVVDLMRLQPQSEHPQGLSDREFDTLFTTGRPVIFAYHGYPWLIHRLTYRRAVHPQLHVRGYKEEGTTTTPFDMVMLNDVDRYHLVIDVIDRVPGLGPPAAYLRQRMVDERLRHRAYTREVGDDMPDVRDWVWPGSAADGVRRAIAELAPLAPLHNPAALQGMEAAAAAFPGVPQVACFDTAFHRTMPPAARVYAVPREWRDRLGLERFGFHGLNVAWCTERAPAM